jgi:hypothetical protein
MNFWKYVAKIKGTQDNRELKSDNAPNINSENNDYEYK